MEVNHKDGDKSNNHLDNLEYVTHTENIRHAESNKLRTPFRGKRWTNVLFSKEDCLNIRDILKDGMSQHNLAKMLGVGQMSISRASRIAIQ
jgi:DNA-directed RNA polymerase specialized sigma subunit